jgi:hypothetical protein
MRDVVVADEIHPSDAAIPNAADLTGLVRVVDLDKCP